MSSDTCPPVAKAVIPLQHRRPIKITTDPNEFQIGMSKRNSNCNKNYFEKNLRDPKRKIKAKNEGPRNSNVI